LTSRSFYYLALILFFVRDLENVSERRKRLFSDFIAASMTAFLGWLSMTL